MIWKVNIIQSLEEKKLVSKLEKQRTKDEMTTVYNIISSYDFSSNSNGMFFNINDFSDD